MELGLGAQAALHHDLHHAVLEPQQHPHPATMQNASIAALAGYTLDNKRSACQACLHCKRLAEQDKCMHIACACTADGCAREGDDGQLVDLLN